MIGYQEILLILVIVILVFGVKRIPEIGRALGKGMKEFRKAKDELKNAIEDDTDIDSLDAKKKKSSGSDKPKVGKNKKQK
ncbi:MAG: twin-arginine translocase TatA/TatE family subunit [Candidatus Aureabacteria bacterium]|nr:twin-arginine translocase TatA/TatE family subunit [Candidatus Auribacterota bacterium]